MMDNDSQTDNAIVPEDKNKSLSLPPEMVQRGLELATRIEQKQGVQPFPVESVRKEYTVRCHPDVMEWIRKEDGSYRLGGSDKQTATAPVYLVLSVDADGVHISCAGKNPSFIGMEGNEERYRLLNALNTLNPFKIPASSLGLFYTLTRPADASLSDNGLLSHIPKDAWKNLSFKMSAGGGQPGYKGPVTKEANPYFDINRDCVEIVILYISMLTDPNSNQSLIPKDPPLKLSFIAIDTHGVDDPVASRELYHAILEIKDPLFAQKNHVNIEDLYKNFPANVTEEKEWKPWVIAYEGKYVKEKGRFEGVTIHPRDGKLFFIVTLSGGEGTLGNKPRQVALLIEGPCHMALGEKEGSFLFDDTQWIYLGKSYAFKGRVSKFALFDKELKDTEYRNLVIVKAKITDIVQE